MQRFMSLSLPLWPTQRRQRPSSPASAAAPADSKPDTAPFTLVHTTTGGERLYALDATALARGLKRGQALADAKAIEPDLRIAPATPDADQRLLKAFARWCGRWSPWTAPDPGRPGLDGVLFDISGCARLFGGEDRLITSMLEAVRAQGLTAHAAITPTIGLAWGLARHAAPREKTGWVIRDDALKALAALPVEALRIGDTATTLRRFGLKHVGDVLDLPRTQLARRFGPELVRRLSQALGEEAETLNPLQHRTPYRARMRFTEALLLLENIKQAAQECTRDLCARLEAEGRGLRQVELHLYRVDGKTHLLGVGTAAPAQDPAHLARLFNEKLDRAEIDIGFGIDVVELCARRTESMSGRQHGLLAAEEVDGEDLARLTDRLVVRLGTESVKSAARRESHLPERAAGWRTGKAPEKITGKTTQKTTGRNTPLALAETAAEPSLAPPDAAHPDRPLLILARPEPAEAVAEIPDGPPRSFVWRRVRHQVSGAEGPERLAPEWWQDQLAPRTRDYFRVETREGRRFWLYREGLYGLETRQPSWFVHGAS